MNKKRFIWLIPVLVMALAMSACKSDDDGKGSGIGDTLSFSDESVYTKTTTLYSGPDIPFTSNAGGSGLITGGKMTFSVGIPSSSRLVTLESVIMDSNSKLNGGFNFMHRAEYTTDTKTIILDFSSITLNKVYNSETVNETVIYIYVDRDCIIKISEIPPDNYGGVLVNVSDFTLKLKRGWNPVSRILMFTATGGTLVIGTGPSDNCKWILE